MWSQDIGSTVRNVKHFIFEVPSMSISLLGLQKKLSKTMSQLQNCDKLLLHTTRKTCTMLGIKGSNELEFKLYQCKLIESSFCIQLWRALRS